MVLQFCPVVTEGSVGDAQVIGVFPEDNHEGGDYLGDLVLGFSHFGEFSRGLKVGIGCGVRQGSVWKPWYLGGSVVIAYCGLWGSGRWCWL